MSYYPQGCDASDYEVWAGTDCDDDLIDTCEVCGEELDENGKCPQDDTEDDDESL